MDYRDDFSGGGFSIAVANMQSGEGFSDTVEEFARCSYRYARGVFYISYSSGNSKVMLKFENGAAEIRRTGEFGSKMVYIPGRETKFDYKTPYGSIAMKLDTRSVEYSLDENGGTAKLEYLLYAGGDKLLNKMTIKIER